LGLGEVEAIGQRHAGAVGAAGVNRLQPDYRFPMVRASAKFGTKFVLEFVEQIARDRPGLARTGP